MNAMNSSESCTLLGILDDGWDGLSAAARARLSAADLVIGAARTLELVAAQLPASAERKDMDAEVVAPRIAGLEAANGALGERAVEFDGQPERRQMLGGEARGFGVADLLDERSRRAGRGRSRPSRRA